MLIILNEDKIILKEPKKDDSKSFSYSYQSSSILKDGESFKKVKEVSDTPEATIIKSKAFKNGKKVEEENETIKLNMLKASGVSHKDAIQQVYGTMPTGQQSQATPNNFKGQINAAGQNFANSNIGQGITKVANKVDAGVNKVASGIGNFFKKFNGQ